MAGWYAPMAARPCPIHRRGSDMNGKSHEVGEAQRRKG